MNSSIQTIPFVPSSYPISVLFYPNEGWEASIVFSNKIIKQFGPSKNETIAKLLDFLNNSTYTVLHGQK